MRPLKVRKLLSFRREGALIQPLYAEIQRAGRPIDCETILFNIDSKKPLGD